MSGGSCSVCGSIIYCKALCKKHYMKLQRHGDPRAGYEHERKRGTGTVTADGYIEIKRNGVSRLEHVLIAERALGHALPSEARVHHVDGNESNNSSTNLVICPNDAYHQLLHSRQRALEGCGNANWLKCQYCKVWDAPQNIICGKRVKFHRACKNSYEFRRTNG